jgi:Xaa-Pro aminopeptidase
VARKFPLLEPRGVARAGDAPERGLFQTDFPPDEFAARRAAVFDAIGAGASALLQGAPPVRGFDVFRQTNEFYYCCGVEVPQACLLLSGTDRTAALYLPHRPEKAGAEGATLAAEDAKLIRRFTGVDAVYGIERLAGHLKTASVLYTPHAPAEGRQASRDELARSDTLVAADPWDGRPARQQHLINLLRARFAGLEVRDLSPTLDALRAIKSPREMNLLRRAGLLAAAAVTEASGENAWHAHYFRNNCAMRDGDLVLMDTAPDYGYYTSDIGRMWPVGGTYAPWQRELYGFMVEYHKALLRRIRPGATADQVLGEAAAEMAKVIGRTRFSKPIYKSAAQRTLEFKGHLSHAVGMAVHDVGDYRSGPLRPGVVFAVDPQMWVPEEKRYIRVEDTVAVTEDGIETLTCAAPLELGDVEAALRRKSAFPAMGT